MKIKNRRIVRHALCITLALLMLLAAAPLTVSAEETKTYKIGDIVEFGLYPQSEVTDEILKNALAAAAGSTDGWTSYGYYIKSTQSDFMKYTDVEYDGEKYRGVCFTKYRPIYTNDLSTDANSRQDDNGYNANTVYWFKFEPLEWQVLSYDATTGNAVVLSKDIIDSQQYYCDFTDRTIDGVTVYANNYEYSDIRAWLNDTFYNTAFGTSEKNAIVATTLDNSAYSTEYNSGFTTDSVWLLSYSEVQNTAYGFATGEGISETRLALGTAYAYCQGVDNYPNYNCSSWRLRSAGDYFSCACIVGVSGVVVYGWNYVNSTSGGVRPALTLNMPAAIKPTEPTTEPVTDPVTEPATEPVTEPSTDPAAADSDETTANGEDNGICFVGCIIEVLREMVRGMIRVFLMIFGLDKVC